MVFSQWSALTAWRSTHNSPTGTGTHDGRRAPNIYKESVMASKKKSKKQAGAGKSKHQQIEDEPKEPKKVKPWTIVLGEKWPEILLVTVHVLDFAERILHHGK